jgi:hypothetical protein
MAWDHNNSLLAPKVAQEEEAIDKISRRDATIEDQGEEIGRLRTQNMDLELKFEQKNADLVEEARVMGLETKKRIEKLHADIDALEVTHHLLKAEQEATKKRAKRDAEDLRSAFEILVAAEHAAMRDTTAAPAQGKDFSKLAKLAMYIDMATEVATELGQGVAEARPQRSIAGIGDRVASIEKSLETLWTEVADQEAQFAVSISWGGDCNNITTGENGMLNESRTNEVKSEEVKQDGEKPVEVATKTTHAKEKINTQAKKPEEAEEEGQGKREEGKTEQAAKSDE